MPHNKKLTPKPHAFPRLFGQTPLTIVKDYSKSIKVDLVKHDDPIAMIDGTYDFVKATWSEDGRESERASYEEKLETLEQMLSGKSLSLGLETVQFVFRISGITRIDTHQIVRQRIGVTFSQQCSGDQFWNHHNVLVEPSILAHPLYADPFIHQALGNKMLYQQMLDTEEISVQAARSILPHCLDTFVFMKVDLATLLFFYQKRIDDGSQTWQMNEISRQMATEVSKVFPALEKVFEKHKTKFKFQKEASKDRKNSLSTGLYLPNPDEFEYHERDFLYNKTKNEMHFPEGLEFEDKYYFGYGEVTKETYEEIQLKFKGIDILANKEHWDNYKIWQENIKISKEYRDK